MESREVVVVSPILRPRLRVVEGVKLFPNAVSLTLRRPSHSEEMPPVDCSSQTRLHKLNSLKVQQPERSMNFSHGHPIQLALVLRRQGASSSKVVATLHFV